MDHSGHRWHWPLLLPLAGVLMFGMATFLPLNAGVASLAALALGGSVIGAVHHAEVVAQRVGEPFGTLVLAVAVTAIETGLLVSLLFAGDVGREILVRDTLYATVMIIASGVMGLCVLLGALRHREQAFRIEGAGPAFAALIALAVLVLIVPRFTISAPGAAYTTSQLIFVALCSLSLWCVFVFFQTIRHRDYFLPTDGREDTDAHAPPPPLAASRKSFVLLLVALVAVIGLAKTISPAIEAAVRAVDAPRAAIGIAVALLVLLPESTAAVRAALADRLQTSLNLALGSALATIGLTVPIVVAVCLAADIPLLLGLEPKDIVLLTLTLLVGTVGVVAGRTNMMYGAVQLVIFAAFLFLSLVP